MEEQSKIHVLCNKCLSPISSGQCFRTTLCHHLICETCAVNHFQTERSCPVCGENLCEEHLAEVVVGADYPNLNGSIFQAMMSDPNWESVAVRKK